MKVYVASSWRNLSQQFVVGVLRSLGHEVYDFKNPPGRTGFSWSEISPDWLNWTPEQYREALKHPVSIAGYESDAGAIRDSDACVFVAPAGRPASWELGYAHGLGKDTYVFLMEAVEPELMFREATILVGVDELTRAFEIKPEPPRAQIIDLMEALRASLAASDRKPEPLDVSLALANGDAR